MAASDHVTYTPISSFLVRIYWLGIGNFAVVVFAIFIFTGNLKPPATANTLYWASVAALILVRYIDIRFIKGETTEGEPATMAHWRSYSLVVASAGLAIWLLATFLGRS